MRTIRAFVGVLLLAAMTQAQEKSCPSDKAAKAGYSPFEAFHKIMAPAWHVAWPDKDFKALIAAGPQFEEGFKAIAAMEANMKNTRRKAAFLENRETFAHLVKQYAEASGAGNADSVYAIMPRLHESFEKTASALAPLPFPEFDGLALTTGMIIDMHLPKDNKEGITGSTETLVMKAQMLTEQSIPEELKDQKEPLLKEFAVIQATVAKMKECSDKDDMAGYKKLAGELDAKLKEISATYL